MTVFFGTNGVMIYLTFGWGQELIFKMLDLDGGKLALVMTGAGLVLILLTYVFDGIMRVFREILEGAKLPGWAQAAVLAERQEQYRKAQSDIDELKRTRREVVKRSEPWNKRLQDARRKGKRKTCGYSDKGAAGNALRRLEEDEFKTTLLEFDRIEHVVALFEKELEAHNADNRDNEASRLLDAHHVRIVDVIDTLNIRYNDEYRSRYLKIQRRFPIEPVATKLGRIAAGLRSYADSRYGMDLEFVWPRLQRILQGDEAYFTSFQEAKLRVDLFVALAGVTGAFTLIWIFVLAKFGYSPGVVLLIAVLGPALCWMWYQSAKSSYEVFVDIAKAGVDLYRLKLLEELRIEQPGNLGQEKSTWDQINRHIAFGEAHTLNYRDP